MFEESPYKIYVDVNVEFTKDGSLIPRVIHWSDDNRYKTCGKPDSRSNRNKIYHLCRRI